MDTVRIGGKKSKRSKPMSSITTVEEELAFITRIWNKLDVSEKLVSITFMFLFIYLLIVVLASYDSLTNSTSPSIGKGIFYLGLLTFIVTFLPVILHYAGISTFGVLHLIGIVGAVLFLVMLWLILENFEKREIDTDSYKDPYSVSVYFLLISFTVMYFIASISYKL